MSTRKRKRRYYKRMLDVALDASELVQGVAAGKISKAQILDYLETHILGKTWKFVFALGKEEDMQDTEGHSAMGLLMETVWILRYYAYEDSPTIERAREYVKNKIEITTFEVTDRGEEKARELSQIN